MSERELALPGERRAALPADEPLALEPVQRRDRVARVAAERAGPKHLPDDGSILEERLLVAGQAVESGGDHALERLGQRQLVGGAALDVEIGELLCVEGLPPACSRRACWTRRQTGASRGAAP